MNNKIAFIFGKNKALFLIACFSELLLAGIILHYSKLELTRFTQLSILGISLFAVAGIERTIAHLKQILDSVLKKLLFILLVLYAAFALVGQRLFIFPLNMHVSFKSIVVFVCVSLWFCLVISSLLYWFDAATKKACNNTCASSKKISTPVFVCISIPFLLLPAIFHLIAFNPGISSPDTWVCMIQNAKNLGGMLDWHPAFYCIVLRVIQKTWDSTYAVVFVQYFFWLYVMIEFLLVLRKKEMPDRLLLGIALFAGVNAGNYVHLNTIWKDIPYALSLLWVLVLFFKLIIDEGFYRKKWFVYTELLLALIGVFFYRKNGFVPFVMCCVAMLLVFRKNRRIWSTFVFTLVCVFLIKGPIYSYFNVQSAGRFGMYIGLGQDILGVYYSGGEISDETLKLVYELTDNKPRENGYTPTYASYAGYKVMVTPTQFVKSYVHTFFKNPVIMSRAIIARGDALWNIFDGDGAVLGCVNPAGDISNYSDQYKNWCYPKRVDLGAYTRLISMLTGLSVRIQICNIIAWRCGVFLLLFLFSLLFLQLKRGIGKYWLLITPIFGQILSLLLSTGWADFRYFWPINLMSLCFIFFVIVIVNKQEVSE